MTRLVLSAVVGMFAGAHPAWAHVTVAPRECRPGISERDTVRVPTEGRVATVEVELEKAHLRYSDGTASHWVGEPGTRSPAPITTLAAASQDDAAAVTAWLATYDAAFNAKDLEKLATFYHPDVTVYEGAGINNGWADYRDRHLGPELKAFQNLQLTHSETTVTVLPGGQSAYATSRYTLKAKMGQRDIDSEGLATYLLLKGANGGWQIRHSHTSSRARRPAA
jgi:uncharacterized protein (TIGR02246 family)